jgi:hypothetical protein
MCRSSSIVVNGTLDFDGSGRLHLSMIFTHGLLQLLGLERLFITFVINV